MISVEHGDLAYIPEFFTSRLAELLENAGCPDNRMTRREFLTTDWVDTKFSDMNQLLDQKIELSLVLNTVEDDCLPGIVMEPLYLPCFPLGSHHALSRYEQARLFNFLSLVYENGLTEVFKAQVLQNTHENNGFHPLINALTLDMYNNINIFRLIDARWSVRLKDSPPGMPYNQEI